MQAIMAVMPLPVSESRRIFVRLESLKGMCLSLLLMAATHLPKVVSPLLMLTPSCLRSPSVSALAVDSEPARSTKLSLVERPP